MDPVSQGVLGAVAALAIAKNNHIRIAAIAGCIGGMLPDLDVLISSDADPLLNIEYHRHFSHSLIFIPAGGLIASLLLLPFFRKRIPFAKLYLYSTLGYATAGLLDACTSYGTHLLWPFSNTRTAWSIISIVDPLFTLPLLALVLISVFKKKLLLGKIAALFALCYLALGALQHQRALRYQNELLITRDHTATSQSTVKPTIANLFLWRSVYRHENTFYVDALRLGFLSENKTYPGQSIPAFDTQTAIDQLPPNSPLAEDYRRFSHFSEGYLAALPDEPTFIVDLRYSPIPNSTAPLWGIDLSDTTETGHATFETRRKISPADRKAFTQMLKGAPLPPLD